MNKKTIRVSDRLHEFIKTHAKGFESASACLERLLKVKERDKKANDKSPEKHCHKN